MVAAAAAVTAVLAHFASIDNKWAYDDKVAIQTNPDVVGHRPLLEAFSNDFWGHSLRPKSAAEDPNANMSWWSHHSYRPLTILSFRANVEMAQPTGLRGAAHVFHATNILIQAAACAAVVPLLTALTGLQPVPRGGKHGVATSPGRAGAPREADRAQLGLEPDAGAELLARPRPSQADPASSAGGTLAGRALAWLRRWTSPRPAVDSLRPSALTVVAAVLFAAHPIHVESVANATHRAEPLCCLFLFLAWAAYERATRPRKHGAAFGSAVVASAAWTLVAAALHIAAVLAKETAIGFPAVVVVADVAATMLRRTSLTLARAPTGPDPAPAKAPRAASPEPATQPPPSSSAQPPRELRYEHVTFAEDVSSCACHGMLVVRCVLVLVWAACVFYGRVVVLTGGYSLNMQAMHNPISTMPSFVDRTLSFGLVQAFAASLLFVPALLSHEHNAIEPVTSLVDPRNLATVALWAGIAAILAWAVHSGSAWRASSQLEPESANGCSAPDDDDQVVVFGTKAVQTELVRPPAGGSGTSAAAGAAARGLVHSEPSPAAPTGPAGAAGLGVAPLALELLPPGHISRRWRLLGGLGIAAASYLPASHVVLVVGFVLAERQLYLPSLGAAVLMAEALLGISDMVGAHCATQRVRAGAAGRLASALGCTALALRPVGTSIRPGRRAVHSGGGGDVVLAAARPAGSESDAPPGRDESSADVLAALGAASERSPGTDGALRLRADGVAVWDRGTSTAELERKIGLSGFTLWLLAIAVALAFVVRSSVRASAWLNDEAIGSDLVARYPNRNPMGRYGSGMTRLYQGKLVEATALLLESTQLSGFAEPRIALSEVLWRDVVPALLMGLNGRPDHEEVMALRSAVRSHCLFGGPGVVVLQVSGEQWVAANYSQGWPPLPGQPSKGAAAQRASADGGGGGGGAAAAGCGATPAMRRPAEAARAGAELLNASTVGRAVRASHAFLNYVNASRSNRREFFGMLGLLEAAIPAADAIDALVAEAGAGGIHPGLTDSVLGRVPTRMFRELPFPGADPTTGLGAFPRLRGASDGPEAASLNRSEFVSLVAQAANTLPASHHHRYVLSSNAFVVRMLSPVHRWGSVKIAMQHAEHASQTHQMTLRVVKANLACMWATAGLLDRAVAEASASLAVARTTSDSGEAVELTVAFAQAVHRFAASEAGRAMAARWAQLDGGTNEAVLKLAPGPHIGYRAQAVGCAFVVMPLSF
ncbi:hypothetical protein FNF29_04509 [Cafeteria roenbergensis]|uniref:DUF1736 domain-containing protein n=2 Tax=Cafeteria roenbergensis TaxID=33653 RepID=A0A5A8CF33_CAFRO|nr:hypothetical protein FNF29_04509 [Cafeteria roenbergensis]|eukprot:KAA0151585.1 hypothetical protein FNF29_04509 [Cafeteria roenbergensis]